MTLNHLAILAIQQSHDKLQVQVLLEEAWQMARASHDQKALAETEWNRAQLMTTLWDAPTDALPHGIQALSLARAIHDQELEARIFCALGYISLRTGDFEEAMHCFEVSLTLYALLRTEQIATQELSLVVHANGTPLTQSLANRASEVLCWRFLSVVQQHVGQVQKSICSGRKVFALAQEIKNVYVQIASTNALTSSLLDVGAYEEALALLQHSLALARTLPPSGAFLNVLVILGRTYHALQQWEEARMVLEEAVAVAERLDRRGHLVVSSLSQLCMHYALVGEWRQAHTYAMQAITIRQSIGKALIMLDFSSQYEIEALLRAGDEYLAREEVQRLGERVGSNRHFRLPYLLSFAIIAIWKGQNEQALDSLLEAAVLAAYLCLPEEQWQIQVVLGNLYKGRGELEQAHTAFREAERIIHGLAQGIEDEGLRTTFVASRQIQQVLQHVHR